MNQGPDQNDLEQPMLTPEERHRRLPRKSFVRTIDIDYGQQFEEKTMRTLMMSLTVVNLLVFLPPACHTLARFFEVDDFGADKFFYCALGFELVTLVEIIVLPIRYSKMKGNRVVLLEMLQFNITRIIAYIGFLLYTTGRLRKGSSLSLFVFPDVALYVVYGCKKDLPGLMSVNFMTSIALVSIANYTDGGSAMTLVFGMAFFFALDLIIVIFFCGYLASLIILLKVYLITPAQISALRPDLVNNFKRNYLMLLLVGFYFFWFTLAYTAMLFGTFGALVTGFLEGNNKPPANALWFGSKIMFWISLFDLLVVVTIVSNDWAKIQEMFKKLRPREITISQFSKGMNLDFIQKGFNYFVKKGEAPETQDQERDRLEEMTKPPLCQICMGNYCDTLFEPCGHYVTCQVCMNEYFKKSFDCFMCKQKIERVHMIYFDSEEKKYKSEGIYEINV